MAKQYYVYKEAGCNYKVRTGVRGNFDVVDKTLTELGFDGAENTDWVNMESTYIIPAEVELSFVATSGVKTLNLEFEIDDTEKITVDWGDTNIEEITGDGTYKNYSHIYSAAGTYEIIIKEGNLDKVKGFGCHTGNLMYVDIWNFRTFTSIETLMYCVGALSNGVISDLPRTLIDVQIQYVNGHVNNLPPNIKTFRMLRGLEGNYGHSDNWPDSLETFDWTEHGYDVSINLDNLPSSCVNLCLDGRTSPMNIYGNTAILGQNNPNMYYLAAGDSRGVLSGNLADLPSAMREFGLRAFTNPDELYGDIKDSISATAAFTNFAMTDMGNEIYGNVEELPLNLQRLTIENTPNIIYGGGLIPAWVFPLGYGITIDNAWSTEMVDDFLIALSVGLPATLNDIEIDVSGSNNVRSSASDSAISTLESNGYIIIANEPAVTIDEILADGDSISWIKPRESEWVKQSSGVEEIYYDILGAKALGNEITNSNIVQLRVYEITACQTDFFYTGCAVGQHFMCGVVKTCDANNKVKEVAGVHFGQFNAAKRPTNGRFNGSSAFMWSGPIAGGLVQPILCYLLIKPKANVVGAILSSNTNARFEVWTRGNNDIAIYANGTAWTSGITVTVDEWVIVRTYFNGSSSEIIKNNDSPLTCDPGTGGALANLAIGCRAYLETTFGDFELAELIVRKSNVSEEDIYDYLDLVRDSLPA